ncbi:MAG TPA: peptidoglycan editing factor PgeF [Acidimicrobiales bacterium]|jgi:hypothetical protein|nr:peptidoglycan editing factor PgeF [Acidimicrobiales bacterium]
MRREVIGGVALHHFGLDSPPDARIVAGVCGRHGGVSAAPYDSLNLALHVGDDERRVMENRRRLCAALGAGSRALTLANQVHGYRVIVVDEEPASDEPVGDADALVTAIHGVLIAVLVADCVPIVVHDPVRRVVAVVHAGWRGTVARVVTHAVQTMADRFGCAPADMVAGIGPSIGPASYEVGADVIDAVHEAFPGVARELLPCGPDGRATHLDLWAANFDQLVALGVPSSAIEVSATDTRTNTAEFFSDRAARPCGRFAAFAQLR